MNDVQTAVNLRHQFAINNAQAAEALLAPRVAADPLRQVYHVMPPANWMNDPCAMVYFQGAYHLFYQYDPYHITPRGMYFGHARSTDLAHWETLPIALAPSEPYELYPHDRQGKNFGIFTGSAAVDGDRLLIMYCGSSYDEDDLLKQTICMATSADGVHFEKNPGNPVISLPPADGSRDFRDPKLWKHDGKWYMLMGSSKDGHGEVLLYTSDDLAAWLYVGVTARSDGRFGAMWECPDFFPLDGRDVLIFSPIRMPGVDTCYMVGRMDYDTGKFAMDHWGKVDKGYEFYAPQTLSDAQGRRIMMGWCNMWHHDGRPTFTTYGACVERGWCGHMSLPRVLSLDERGALRSSPAPESARLRKTPSHNFRYDLNDAEQVLPMRFSKAAEFDLTLDFGKATQGVAGIRVRRSEDGHRHTTLLYDVAAGCLTLDRTHADGIYNDCQVHKAASSEGRVHLRLFVDSTSLEVFACDGLLTASNNIYPHPEDVSTSLFSHGLRCSISIEGWNLTA